MRILVCSLEAPIPPFHDGLRLVAGAVLRQLREQHDLRVLAYRKSDQVVDPHDQGMMRLLPHPIRTNSAFRRLDQAGALARAMISDRPQRVDAIARQLRAPLRKELESFQPDLIQIFSGMLALLGPELAGQATVLSVLDAWYLEVETLACESAGLRRRLYSNAADRVRQFEATQYRQFGRVITVSDAERDALHAIDPSMRLEVIPNGVDTDYYSARVAGAVDPDRIVFHGVMDYPPNVVATEFLVHRVLPRVRAVRPRAHLVVVGRSPTPEIRALARLPWVSVTGEVADIRPWLQGSRVSACLMRIGTGIKNKLLEAMACGVPCVATSFAVRGLTAAPGRELLVSDDEETLAAHLVRVLDDDALAARLGRAGQDYVRREHDWGDVARRYEAVYQEVLAAAGSAT